MGALGSSSMNASLRVLMSATALTLSAVALPALAADYEPPIVVDQPIEEVPVEVGSGWYLRGDIGYNVAVDEDGSFDFRTFDPATGVTTPSSFDTASLDEGLTYGIGFGYHFTDMLRADFTFDGYRTGFDGTTSSATPCPGFPLGTGCRSEDSSEASVLNFMVNGYVDLGTFVGLTPYVGAGIGYSYVDWSSLGSNLFCTGAGCPPVSPGSTEVDGEQSWRFAWAVMAGLAYDVSKNLKLDLGYRYRRIDSGPMFSVDATAATAGVEGDDPGFSTHEVRLGVRYDLW
jgi:opacity protein-like surface antigen